MSASDALNGVQFVHHEVSQTQWGLPALHVKALHEGKVIGGLSVFQRRHDGEQTPVAHPNVWVDEEHQRKGVATAMYAKVKQHWPDVPIRHSEHASDAAKALNRAIERR